MISVGNIDLKKTLEMIANHFAENNIRNVVIYIDGVRHGNQVYLYSILYQDDINSEIEHYTPDSSCLEKNLDKITFHFRQKSQIVIQLSQNLHPCRRQSFDVNNGFCYGVRIVSETENILQIEYPNFQNHEIHMETYIKSLQNALHCFIPRR